MLGLTALSNAQELDKKAPPALVEQAPAMGTFFLLGRIPSPPFPFDPYYGALPVYAYDGVFFVDDSSVSLFAHELSSGPEGGGMMLMSGMAPCDPCPTNNFSGTNGTSYLGGWTTNAGLKFAPTPVVQGGVFSTRLQEADTNSAYEIYERFQLNTNFPWLRIAAGEVGQTNFSWSLFSTNTAFYLAADAMDSDFDGLSDAFEQLVAHTLPLDDDFDNDGILDGDEDFNGNGIPDRADYARLSRAVIFTSIPQAVEGGAEGEVTVLLPFAAPTNGTKIILHLGGAAEFGADYELFTLSGQAVTNDLLFNAGETQKKLRVRTVNDTEQASRLRHVSLALAWSTNFLLDARRADVTLVENDLPRVTIVASDPKAAESPVAATNKGEFIIRRYGTNTAALTVNLSFSGTATNGSDYTVLPASPVIPAGSRELVLTITPMFDTVFEDTETVIVTVLSSAAYAIPANFAATVSLLDDDLPLVRFAATDPVATEYNSLKAATITLWRTGNVTRPLTVPLAVGGTASNLVDYRIFTNNVLWWGSNVTFAAGSNSLALSIRPLADASEEQAESVIFTIKGSAAYKIGTSNTVMVFVDDDHTTRYQVVPRKYATVYEPGTIDSPAVFDLLRWGRSSLAAQVPFEMWTNAAGGSIRTTLYRKYGDISGENFVFAPFANYARLHATATTGGSPGSGLGAISLKVPLIDTSFYAMWLRPKHEYVRLEIIQTNAVEGTATYAKLRATRLFNGPTVQVYFTVTGNAKNNVEINPDHQMFSSVQFSMPTNVLVKETNIVAVADGNLEGWETVILTANDPPSIETTYEFHAPYFVFLRDNVSTVTGLPEYDTDKDGLSDRWEAANGLDPLTRGEEVLDPDKDGLTNADEAALNLNPNDADTDDDGVDDFTEANRTQETDENYLAVRLFTRDTGKVNNGANCAVCHTTTLRVGDYVHFNPTRSNAFEKKFFFKRGTNYPIYLSELVQDLPPTGPVGNPTTTELYTAGIVPAENEPRAFVVNDPNAKLGTNKPWSNFPTDPTVSVGTLVVPKIEVFWTNISGNVALDANTNANGGVRMFPDALSPSDAVNRNRVRVRVKTTPPLSGQTVRLKSFDVDDPAPEVEAGILIDANGEGGKDNRGAPQEGALANPTLTLNAQGEATTDFFVTWQPGDNFRVAALLDTTGASAHLDTLQVTNPAGPMFLTADQTFVKGFAGGLSPMLTVWRKLHLEFDSMEAPPANGPEANFVSGKIFGIFQNSPVAGRTRVKIAHATQANPNDNRFERGKLEIPGVGTYPVSRSLTVVGQIQYVTFLDVPGIVPVVANGTAVRLYDDDDQFLADDSVYRSRVGLASPQLPVDARGAEFCGGMQGLFSRAYLQLVDANALGWNTQRTIAFKRNADVGRLNSPFDVGNLQLKGTDRPEFWAYSIVLGHEGSETEDGEPDNEEPLLGINADDFVPSNLEKFCVVYLEAVRDKSWGLNRENTTLLEARFDSDQWAPTYRDFYLDRLYGVIAHELGHAPGTGLQSLLDHLEQGIMQKGASTPSTDSFSTATIQRFRSALKWTP